MHICSTNGRHRSTNGTAEDAAVPLRIESL